LYKIIFTKSAEKDYRYLHEKDRLVFERIRKALHFLAKDPHQGKPLRLNLRGNWSYRVGMYRIIYSIEHAKLIVYILEIGHRREIYR
jgi:mRNA interferase RelE/StbE